MASDGTIKISTELDDVQARKAMSKFGNIAKTGFKTAAVSVLGFKTALAGVSLYAIKTGIEFESAFAGVKKTVNATAEELEGFRGGIRDMAKDIPQTAAEIAGVAEAAGQLGIQNESILDFTRVMSDLGVATNMSATEAATSLARLANITQMPQEKFGNLGSTVVALGNNLATTEREITEMGLRLAGAGEQVGMSEAQILGLAGALSSVGIEADAGGSAMSTVMSKIQLAVEKGGESLEQFADVAGMSAEDFKAAFQEDAAGAIVSFITGLGTMEDRGQSAIATLADMEITEIRQRDALLRLSGAGDVLSKSLGIATQAWDDNNALTDEAAQRYETLESRLQILKNNVADFGISIYDGLREPLKTTVNEGIVYVERLHGAFKANGLNGVISELGNVFDDVTDDIAGASDAAAGIVTPIKNIVSVGGALGKSVLPVAADGVKFLAENFDVLLPLVVGGTAAFKAYSAIGKITASTVKANAAATAILGKMEKANALQLTATNGGLTIRQTLLAIHNKQITVTTALTGLWAKAQNALNVSMAANPIGTVVVAAAALAAGLVAVSIATEKASEKSYELSDKEKELIETTNEATEALNEQRASREESVQAIDMEYDGYSALLSELQSITDENGRVKAGYEDRAAVITGQLADALGTEIELTDGVIQNYQETVSAIEEVIVKKKAEALCTALQEDMANAYKESKEAMLAYKDAVAVAEGAQKDLDEAQENYNEVMEQYAGDTSPKAIHAIEEAEASLEDAQDAFDKASDSVDGAKTALDELSTEVNNYDALVQAMAEGNAEAIESAMNSLLTGYQSYTAEMLESSKTAQEEMLAQAKEDIDVLSLLLEEGGSSYQAFGEEAADAVVKSVSNFNNLPGGITAAIERIGPESAGAMLSALAQADLDGKLSEEGKKSVESLLTAFDDLEPETQEAFANVVYGALEGLDGFDQLADPAEEGADVFLESLRDALEIHSPSRATEEIFSHVWPGASEGLEEGKDELSTKGQGVIQSFLENLGGEGLVAKAQGIGSKIMSFFGVGVSSQSGNSYLAGKENADQANEGAGSVNPTGTGSAFGGLFGRGIGGMLGLLFGQGKAIGDNAKLGAGSVNPTPEGSKFGSRYAGGVGSKSGEALAKAKGLSSSAYAGAGSADGYTPGSDFGAGFVRGIGAWLGKAASAAANLAMSAWNALRNALDEHSPSRKTKLSGKNFDLGFGGGIKENKKVAIQEAEEMTEETLDALDISAINEKMKGIDVSEAMARVYLAVEDKQNRVASRVTSAVSAKEQAIWKDREKEQKIYMSDDDIEKLAKEFAHVAAYEMSKELEGIGIYTDGRQWGRMVREVREVMRV